MDELIFTEYDTACHTDGCMNQDIVIRGNYGHQPDSLPVIFCGPCCQEIVDIQPII